MAEETEAELERAEKQRLLAELEQNGPFQKKTPRHSTEIEDVNALAGLYRHSIGLNEEPAPAEETLPESPSASAKSLAKITHYEIQAMRNKAAVQQTTAASTQKQFADFFIRAWFDIVSVFQPRTDKRTRCQLEGHTCKHCGAKFHKVPSENE